MKTRDGFATAHDAGRAADDPPPTVRLTDEELASSGLARPGAASLGAARLGGVRHGMASAGGCDLPTDLDVTQLLDPSEVEAFAVDLARRVAAEFGPPPGDAGAGPPAWDIEEGD